MQLLGISEPDSLPKSSDLNRAIGVRWLGVFFLGWVGGGFARLCRTIAVLLSFWLRDSYMSKATQSIPQRSPQAKDMTDSVSK